MLPEPQQCTIKDTPRCPVLSPQPAKFVIRANAAAWCTPRLRRCLYNVVTRASPRLFRSTHTTKYPLLELLRFAPCDRTIHPPRTQAKFREARRFGIPTALGGLLLSADTDKRDTQQ